MLLGLLVISSIILVFYNFYWKRRNLPPGPTPLPVWGNVLTLARLPPGYDAFLNWRKQYGPVYTYWIGELPIVAVADYPTIRDTFIKDAEAYAGRYFFTEFFTVLRGDMHGIIVTEGDLWRSQRRFALQAFRDFGMGKNMLEQTILTEVKAMYDQISEDLAKGVKEHNIAQHIDVAVGSVINQVVFGYRFSGEHLDEFYEIKRFLDEQVRLLSQPTSFLMMMFTPLRMFWPFSSTFAKMRRNIDEMWRFFDKQIANYKPIGEDSKQVPFVEVYMKEIEARKNDPQNQGFTKDGLRMNVFDLWAAGQETTSTTLAFGFLYLLLDYDAQKRLQEELDSVVPPEEDVTLAHRSRLPYTNAVVNELQRLCNLLPQNLIHRTTKDVNIGGYSLPAGTVCLPQISCVLFDESVFPEPQRFRPERFLDEEGQLKKVEEMIPFSVGKRQCAGEALARMELFLFTANLFHKFKLLPADPLKPPSVAKECGFAVRPTRYTCRIVKRFQPSLAA